MIKNKVSKKILGGGVTDFFFFGGGGGLPPPNKKNGPAGNPGHYNYLHHLCHALLLNI